MIALRWLSRLFSLILIGGVRFYQKAIGPWVGNVCRYEPSCSNYFIQAVEKYGPVIGAWKGILRILRCNPFCGSGYDPP